MAHDDGKAEALHLATYSGWYRFKQHDQQWIQTDRALTFWKMTSLQVDPDDARQIYLATEHSGLFVTGNGGSGSTWSEVIFQKVRARSVCIHS